MAETPGILLSFIYHWGYDHWFGPPFPPIQPKPNVNKPKTVAIIAGGGTTPGLNTLLKSIAINLYTEGVTTVKVANLGDLHRTHFNAKIFTMNDAIRVHDYSASLCTGICRYVGDKESLIQRILNIGADAYIFFGGDGGLSLAAAVAKKGPHVWGVAKTHDGNVGVVGYDGYPIRLLSVGFETVQQRIGEHVAYFQSRAKKEKTIFIYEVPGLETGHLTKAVAINTKVPYFINEDNPTLANFTQTMQRLQRTGGVILVAEALELRKKNGGVYQLTELRPTQFNKDPALALAQNLEQQEVFKANKTKVRSVDLKPLLANTYFQHSYFDWIENLKESARTQQRVNVLRVSEHIWEMIRQQNNHGILTLNVERVRQIGLEKLSQYISENNIHLVVISDQYNFESSVAVHPTAENGNRTQFQSRETARTLAHHYQHKHGIQTEGVSLLHLLMAEIPTPEAVIINKRTGYEVAKHVTTGSKPGSIISPVIGTGEIIAAPLESVRNVLVGRFGRVSQPTLAYAPELVHHLAQDHNILPEFIPHALDATTQTTNPSGLKTDRSQISLKILHDFLHQEAGTTWLTKSPIGQRITNHISNRSYLYLPTIATGLLSSLGFKSIFDNQSSFLNSQKNPELAMLANIYFGYSVQWVHQSIREVNFNRHFASGFDFVSKRRIPLHPSDIAPRGLQFVYESRSTKVQAYLASMTRSLAFQERVGRNTLGFIAHLARQTSIKLIALPFKNIWNMGAGMLSAWFVDASYQALSSNGKSPTPMNLLIGSFYLPDLAHVAFGPYFSLNKYKAYRYGVRTLGTLAICDFAYRGLYKLFSDENEYQGNLSTRSLQSYQAEHHLNLFHPLRLMSQVSPVLTSKLFATLYPDEIEKIKQADKLYALHQQNNIQQELESLRQRHNNLNALLKEKISLNSIEERAFNYLQSLTEHSTFTELEILSKLQTQFAVYQLTRRNIETILVKLRIYALQQAVAQLQKTNIPTTDWIKNHFDAEGRLIVGASA